LGNNGSSSSGGGGGGGKFNKADGTRALIGCRRDTITTYNHKKNQSKNPSNQSTKIHNNKKIIHVELWVGGGGGGGRGSTCSNRRGFERKRGELIAMGSHSVR